MTKAYSYLRFSTPEQRHGDSIRRQTEAARQFALRHQLELDTELTFEDTGVSAFRGANANKGALRGFLRAIEDNLIEPGSVLILENLDRMSRRAPWEALPTLQEIINAGVALGIPMKDKIIDRAVLAGASGVFVLMEILIDLQRAHEESATKSKRLKAAWAAKRSRSSNQLLTRIVPGWLEVREGRAVLLEDRAEVVRGIFSKFLEGVGKESIARDLNERGVPVFGDASQWHRSYIQKMLTSPAVVGTYIPHAIEHDDAGRKRRKPLEPVPGYFPAVVDDETFERVQSMVARAGARGRHAGKTVQSILAGLARCPRCGGTMTRVTKGSRSVPYFACVAAKAGNGCEYKAVKQSTVEDVLVREAAAWLGEMPHSDAGVDNDIANHSAQLDLLGDRMEELHVAFEKGEVSAAAFGAARDRLEAQHEALRGELDALLEKAERSEAKVVKLKASKALDALREQPLDRAKVNASLRQLLEGVVIDYRSGFLELRWRHGGATSVLYTMPVRAAVFSS
jgi:DNA invertase Pin-like site-specific DNA recombinase